MIAIITMAIGKDYERIAKLTYPSIRNYAEKINADFINLEEDCSEIKDPHWKKFCLYKYFQKYDRILWLDSDLIIRDDCPNLFEFVPENRIGIFEEGKYISRGEYIKGGIDIYKIPFEWDGRYFNTGVMVLSKCHARLFTPPSKEIKESKNFVSGGMIYTFLGEQTYLNIRILTDDVFSESIFELNYRFNRMTLMDEITGEPRHTSYIIHYAGCPSKDLMEETIEKDLKEWKKSDPNYIYKKNIVFSVSGGLGDQVCAEPVIRHCKNKLFPDDNLYILTHFPTLFKHLKLPTYKPDYKFNFSEGPYNVRYLYPDTNHPIWKILTNAMINTTDFASISACGRILPDEDKTIHLEPYSQGLFEVLNIISLEEMKDLVLIHPGNGYRAKSFPIEWWNGLIKSLLDKEMKIGLIGKTINEKQGYLKVDCPEGVIDFRDFLSLDGLMTLIGFAKILVTNDSAPVHIAGAFDNWIVLIPTMKHPDHILPVRNGNRYYKAIALYKKLTVDDVPKETDAMRLNLAVDNIKEYLPDTEKVIEQVLYINKICRVKKEK